MVDSASMLTAFVFASFLYLVYIFWLVYVRGDSGDEGCFDLTDTDAKVIGWTSLIVMAVWGIFLTQRSSRGW